MQELEIKQLNTHRDMQMTYPDDFKDRVANQIKQMGKEMALDIVKLSRRISSINADVEK